MTQLKAEIGDTVIVYYTASFENGIIYDTNRNKNPLQLELGTGFYIPGFEKMILGMSIGQHHKKILPPEEAFGKKRNDMIFEIPTEIIPEHINKKIGQKIEININPTIQGTIIAVTAEAVKLDANLKQAGVKLVMEVELVDILDE